jgi:hypothetical protein
MPIEHILTAPILRLPYTQDDADQPQEEVEQDQPAAQNEQQRPASSGRPKITFNPPPRSASDAAATAPAAGAAAAAAAPKTTGPDEYQRMDIPAHWLPLPLIKVGPQCQAMDLRPQPWALISPSASHMQCI